MTDSYSPEEHQKASTYKAQIDIKTIKTIMGIIDVSTTRGTFMANELSLVGQIYDTLEKGVISSLEKARKDLYSSGVKPPQQQIQQISQQQIPQQIPQQIQQPVMTQEQINQLAEQKAQQMFQQFQYQQQLLQQQQMQQQQMQQQQMQQQQMQQQQMQQQQQNQQFNYQNILAQQIQVPDIPQQLQPIETRNTAPLSLPLELQPIDTRDTGSKELVLPNYESMRNEVAPPVQYINSGQQ